jgi:hypothetical protein
VIPEHAEDDAEDQVLITENELIERIQVTLPAARNQNLVLLSVVFGKIGSASSAPETVSAGQVFVSAGSTSTDLPG